jgi:glycoprotein endo-alpha-1,2-mannosidase
VRPGLTLLAAAATLLLPAFAWATFVPSPDRDAKRDVAIFYYAWYGTPARDGNWIHWNQHGSRPPRELGATFYPARGPYSSTDAALLDSHVRELAAAGVTTLIASWWGRGSFEDERLQLLAQTTARHDLKLAVHLEPYDGRTAETVAADLVHLRAHAVRDVYVYNSSALADEDWGRINAQAGDMRLFANTRLPGKAKSGGFEGLYTYDVLLYNWRLFPRMCEQARRLALLCAPSVGPGYDARNATHDERVRPRHDGRTYDWMWRGAIAAQADVVTITSYNEWHEGTQIEPARTAGTRYQSYEGAWGLNGPAAQTAYLDRTAYWSTRFRGGPGGVIVP